MDPLLIARLEFAATASAHFLMVATTLGLAPVVAALQSAVWRAERAPAGGSSARLNAALDLMLRLYLINYGVGIVTGIVMELQMAVNWTGAGSALYDPVAALLGIETLAAFFVESTLLGLFLISRGQFSQGVRAVLLWGVAATAWLSAWVVVAANSYLQKPVGVSMVGGHAVFTDLRALLLQGSTLSAVVHIAGAAGLVAAFWLAAAGAQILLRGETGDPAGRLLLRLGVLTAAVSAPVNLVSGVIQFSQARALGTTNYGMHGLLLALMMLTGVLILVTTWLVWLPLLRRGRLYRARPALRLMRVAVWVPLVTCLFGWIYREESRQPWFINGKVLVADAVSVPGGIALPVTAIAFVLIGIGAIVLAWVLMGREIRRPVRRSEAVAA